MSKRRIVTFPPENPYSDGSMLIRVQDDRVGFAVAGSAVGGPEGWLLRGACSIIDGALALETLSVSPWVPLPNTLDALAARTPKPSRIESEVLRAISTPSIELVVHDSLRREGARSKELEAHVLRLHREFGLALPRSFPAKDAADLLQRVRGVGTKRGRKPWTDDFYRWVARTYLRCVESEGTLYECIGAAALRNGLVKRQPEPGTVKKWIAEARRRQFLLKGPGRRSVAGLLLDTELDPPSTL